MAEFKHRKCGGRVSIDIASQFLLKTHSVMVTPSEVRLGVMELVVRGKQGNPMFVCEKCDERFDVRSDLDNVTAMCLVCSKTKPVTQMYVSYAFPCICEACKKEVCGEGKEKGEKSKLQEVFDLSGSNIKFVSFVEVLNKPIS